MSFRATTGDRERHPVDDDLGVAPPQKIERKGREQRQKPSSRRKKRTDAQSGRECEGTAVKTKNGVRGGRQEETKASKHQKMVRAQKP